MPDTKKTEKQLLLIPNYLGIKHPEAWLPPYFYNWLQDLDLIFCESYKSAETLLDRQKLPDVELFEINEHTNWKKAEPEVMQLLLTHHKIGVLSDAGMPCIADPGEKVVAIAHQLGINVDALPGPNSMILALALSGFNGERFSFYGYAPIQVKDQEKWLSEMRLALKNDNSSCIFMETPYRNVKLVEMLIGSLANDIHLCAAINLLSKESKVVSKSIAEWSVMLNDREAFNDLLHKKPAVFVIGKPANT